MNSSPIAWAFVLIVGCLALELIRAEYGNILRLVASIEATRHNFESASSAAPISSTVDQQHHPPRFRA